MTDNARIFETHAHYDDEAFAQDRDELIASLPEQGIEAAINVGANMESSAASVELAQRYAHLYAAVGVHPSDTEPLQEADMQKLKKMVMDCRKVVAIGEIGLDYYWPEPSRDLQKFWFSRQLELAREVQLPVIIHSRDAEQDTEQLMKAAHAEEIGGVIHCYSYSVESARAYLQMGFYFGIGGVVTFKNGRKMKEVVQYLPLDRILLETDSPYLAPEPHRGSRNSSLQIPNIAQAIALLKNISYEEVVAQTNRNARRLFLKEE